MSEITAKEIQTVKDLLEEITKDVIETLANSVEIQLSQDDFKKIVNLCSMQKYHITYEEGFNDFLLFLSGHFNPITQAYLAKHNDQNDDSETKMSDITYPYIQQISGKKFSVEEKTALPDEWGDNINIIVRWNERYFSIKGRENSWGDNISEYSEVQEVVPRKIEIIRFFPKQELK